MRAKRERKKNQKDGKIVSKFIPNQRKSKWGPEFISEAFWAALGSQSPQRWHPKGALRATICCKKSKAIVKKTKTNDIVNVSTNDVEILQK